jgi:hypothetical protein
MPAHRFPENQRLVLLYEAPPAFLAALVFIGPPERSFFFRIQKFYLL